ncbi:MAG: DUF1367 family protein [Sterolibacterium sp.]
MAVDVLLIREGNALKATDAIGAETLAEITHGEIVTCSIRRARNPRHHRLFFALLKIVMSNQDRYATTPQLLTAIKLHTGYYDLNVIPGKMPITVCIPKSISFAAMSQAEFREFYDKAVAFIITEVLPGVDSADLEREVLNIIGA